MDVNSEDVKEKRDKAGHPLFIVIIFVALLGFLFFIPDIYKKYNSEISDFLGIGKEEQDKKPEEDNKTNRSAFYQIGSKSTLKFNEIELTDIALSSDKKTLSFNANSEDVFELDKANYYLEFFEDRKTFVGRRLLLGRITKSLPFEIDISNMDIDTTTYFVISYIPDDTISPLESESDESGLASITCKKGDFVYDYELYLKKLTKVTKKQTYSNPNLEEYAKELLEARKLEKTYNEYTGVNASIVEETNSFIFLSSFDYENVTSFSKLKDNKLFQKGTYNNVIKFKMEAEGYECS